MKFKMFHLGLFLFACAALEARCPFSEATSNIIEQLEACCQDTAFPHAESHFGTCGRGNMGPDEWYTITTDSYPDVVLLSQQQNMGSSKGGVYISPTGFTIGEAGNYWISITAILQNPGSDTILVPVFLVKNETFDPENPLVGGVATLEPGLITNLHGTGIVEDIGPGTRLSLVASNGDSSLEDVTVIAWAISLFKLP